MKHIKIFFLFLLFASATVKAQDTNMDKRLTSSNYPVLAKKNTEGMKASLKLSDEQAKEIIAIEEHFYKSVLAISVASSIDVRKERLENLQMEKEESFKKVLTSEQWKQYQFHISVQKKKTNEQMEERKKKWIAQKG